MRIRSWNFALKLTCGFAVGLTQIPLLAFAAPSHRADEQALKPRVVITDDPELDDNNTVIRAILYSSDMRIEGLVYASSQFHWRGDGKGTTQYIAGREYTRMGLCPCTTWRFSEDEHFIDSIVDAYAKVYSNLKVHDPDYPSPAELKAKIKWGNVDFDGDFSHDSDGSNLIKSLLLDDVAGPLYVTAGGGESTIARALKSIHDEYAKTPQWEAIRSKVSRKLIIIRSGDQDGTGASYIAPNWPDVRQYDFMGINFGYGAQDRAAAQDKIYFTPEWTRENILSRGPLGALYRVWGDGKQMVKGDRTDYFGLSGYTAEQLQKMGYMVWMHPEPKGSFLGEGDTPVFLNLVDNGLRAYQNPAWGGWGGWMRPGQSSFTAFGAAPPVLPADTSGVARGLAPAGSDANRPKTVGNKAGSVGLMNFHMPQVPPRTAAIAANFFAAAENDFAARLQWSVTPKYTDANHPPVVGLEEPLAISARPGSTVRLKGKVTDPDHNSVQAMWWQYNDAGTYPGDITLAHPEALTTSFRVPDDAKPGQTIDVILQATDNGTPSLTRYQRVIVTVQ
jgi:Cellulose-binding Sde182, nucleoside hydrolase-like domain/Cellulose-binding protein Sde0182, C-terminal domain